MFLLVFKPNKCFFIIIHFIQRNEYMKQFSKIKKKQQRQLNKLISIQVFLFSQNCRVFFTQLQNLNGCYYILYMFFIYLHFFIFFLKTLYYHFTCLQYITFHILSQLFLQIISYVYLVLDYFVVKFNRCYMLNYVHRPFQFQLCQ
ncbi:hypothetical protein IMG5_123390 [Ichthyophthirius multifiliis]|uniref:Transmembrane protein n=1 Tax=Ichthyophthirius multifiliis TaxID=5932 RepID=G0QVG0_ICHMU|nr:hypothetical protein IMG5_123390 [Ichthyophthirius multifiliis]EGR30796.1 hypothetical protein IMG5_123390 [Ichthyophthirius multifiliis]|eukprot:XP_004032383.1 hypothetical protein IMG5_123390 [Ichthyophthirius multifiliis]